MAREIAARKDEHIQAALHGHIEGPGTTLFECVTLVHNALPELNMDEIHTQFHFLGKNLQAPLIIGAITGGTPQGKRINHKLAQLAKEFGLALAVGSQRIALEHPETAESFAIVKEVANEIPIIANIGAVQVTNPAIREKIPWLVEMIGGAAVAVHLNPLQEILQKEGEPQFSGVLTALHELQSTIKVPVIVKETGGGLSPQVIAALKAAGIQICDVAGSGGTSFAKIEQARLHESLDSKDIQPNHPFFSWGIPTAACLVGLPTSVKKDLTIIASGGIRSGLDMAKALALGADCAAIALPVLQALDQGIISARTLLSNYLAHFRHAMFLTGVRTPGDLKTIPRILYPPLSAWEVNTYL